MKPKKVMMVFGTRPEAIKMAPLYHALRNAPEDFETRVCVTAQHRHMLDQVLNVFGITPDADLNLMQPGQDLFDVTASVLLGMRETLRMNPPDVLLVHGDTTTTLASAMAGFYAGVPVGHVEAGLRTHRMHSPFPEEFNRQATTRVTRWHFAPTQSSRANLLTERVDDACITVTGNTVIDAMFWILARIEADPARRARMICSLNEQLPFDWTTRRFLLVTGHRRENFGNGFLQICAALKELAWRFPDLHIVYPVHLNPQVSQPVHALLAGLHNIHLIEPLDYEPFIYLLKHSHIVVTDSGGIQEEAPSLGKPVLVLRDVTERPEALAAGTVRLVGTDRERIVANAMELLNQEESYTAMARAHNPYGDGKACRRILESLKQV